MIHHRQFAEWAAAGMFDQGRLDERDYPHLEAVADALSGVYSGASEIEAMAFIDRLQDEGLRIAEL